MVGVTVEVAVAVKELALSDVLRLAVTVPEYDGESDAVAVPVGVSELLADSDAVSDRDALTEDDTESLSVPV